MIAHSFISKGKDRSVNVVTSRSLPNNKKNRIWSEHDFRSSRIFDFATPDGISMGDKQLSSGVT